jgi:hypothetical protein
MSLRLLRRNKANLLNILFHIINRFGLTDLAIKADTVISVRFTLDLCKYYTRTHENIMVICPLEFMTEESSRSVPTSWSGFQLDYIT